MRETTSKDRFRRALLLMKPAHTGHHPGAVPGFRPSPGNSEETTTRVLTEEISVLFRVPTWDPTHPGSPVSRALPGNTPTQGPTREGKPGFFLGGGGNPGRNPGHGLGKTRERGGFRAEGGEQYVGVMSGIVSDRMSGLCRYFSGLCREYVGTMSVLRRDYVGVMSGLCRVSASLMSGPSPSQGGVICPRKGHLDPAWPTRGRNRCLWGLQGFRWPWSCLFL